MEKTGRTARQHVNEMLTATRPYVELEQQAEALGQVDRKLKDGGFITKKLFIAFF